MEFPAATKGKNSFLERESSRWDMALSQPVACEKKCRWVSSLRIDDTILQLGSIFVRCLPRGREGESTAGGIKPKEYGDYHLIPSYTKKWLQDMGIILLHRTW